MCEIPAMTYNSETSINRLKMARLLAAKFRECFRSILQFDLDDNDNGNWAVAPGPFG